ncbi:MAG: esterase [Gemmatimonadetes bacterium]|nr:esterase [Gemmatimonadota bacterium]
MLAMWAAPLVAQTYPHPLQGSVARITVHGASLEGNLSSDPADRLATVYLPPGYAAQMTREYPVLYALHGYTDDDLHWMGWQPHFVNLVTVIDSAIASGALPPLIVVMPNAYTRFQGSMYSNSVTTGYWEEFVAGDLVAYVDAHYRTIEDRTSRGLMGHSMGGYGATRGRMKHPHVFGSVYAMSPRCRTARGAPATPEALAALQRYEAITSMEAFEQADFGTRAQIASAAAWAPNPNNPPFFLDLPTKNGELQPQVLARFAANAPLAFIDQYIPSLRRIAFGIDSGDEDRGIAPTVTEVHRILDQYRVAHEYGIYPGNHINNVHARIRSTVLPFFARTLAIERAP